MGKFSVDDFITIQNSDGTVLLNDWEINLPQSSCNTICKHCSLSQITCLQLWMRHWDAFHSPLPGHTEQWPFLTSLGARQRSRFCILVERVWVYHFQAWPGDIMHDCHVPFCCSLGSHAFKTTPQGGGGMGSWFTTWKQSAKNEPPNSHWSLTREINIY